MRGYYTPDQVREAEAELFTRVPAGLPMRRAAYGLASVVAGELRSRTGGVVGRTVTLLVGAGDNGGDALWAGAGLARRGVRVRAILLAPDRAHPGGLAALRRAGGRCVNGLDPIPDLIIDGIVGISGHGPLRPPAASLVQTARHEYQVPVVSADLPSGVDPLTGVVTGAAVRADVTVAFGAYKPVHALAKSWCGRIQLVPIGLTLPPAGLAELLPAEAGGMWPVPGAADDKYSQGVTGIVAGSPEFPGAAVLCTAGALAATSGMVRYAGPSAVQVVADHPEVIAVHDISDSGRVQAWVVGPGMGTGEAALATLRTVLASELPVLVDADGITLLAAHPELVRDRQAPTVLTPHAGEFARLTRQPLGPDRVAAVRELAREWQVTVLLKGRATLIAHPGGAVLVNEAGGSWAATAGAGDVLSGVIGALLAAGIPVRLACAAGARAHSLAANLAARGAPVTAAGLAGHLSEAIRVLRQA